jgi:hypothetical protein
VSAAIAPVVASHVGRAELRDLRAFAISALNARKGLSAAMTHQIALGLDSPAMRIGRCHGSYRLIHAICR